MILPTKHLRSDRALLAVGSDLLVELDEPKTVSRLWDDLRKRKGRIDEPALINYDWFILALDLLFMLGAIKLERGLLRKTSQ
jgi:hypothetical protein